MERKIRIISRFKDYYDSSMAFGYGGDDGVLYIRQKTEYPLSTAPSATTTVPDIVKVIVDRLKQLTVSDIDTSSIIDTSDWPRRTKRGTVLQQFSDKNYVYDTQRFGVLFCGKYYPGLRVSMTRKPSGYVLDTAKHHWFYDADDAIAFMESKGVDVNASLPYRHITITAGLRKYFNTKPADVEWQIENKITCVVYEMYNNQVVINPPLKDYEFFKVMDPYTAFQELSMWVGGTLAWPPQMMIELDDKYRVLAHGFDKHSFRKSPTKRGKIYA